MDELDLMIQILLKVTIIVFFTAIIFLAIVSILTIFHNLYSDYKKEILESFGIKEKEEEHDENEWYPGKKMR